MQKPKEETRVDQIKGFIERLERDVSKQEYIEDLNDLVDWIEGEVESQEDLLNKECEED